MNGPNDINLSRLALCDAVSPVGTERVPLSSCMGRISAEDTAALENCPAFDRAAFDGYAFRAEDTAAASADSPAELSILEEIAAGGTPHFNVTVGTAVKILTGAPLPQGADAVCKYEETEFSESTVKLFRKFMPRENVVSAGGDVFEGELLARTGTVFDAGNIAALSSQGISAPLVYKRPRAGIISTGSEIVDIDRPVGIGKIRNSNRYMLEAALTHLGCEPYFLGMANDSAEDIAGLVLIGLSECDVVVMTGGASTGDYDLTARVFEMLGAEMLVRHTSFKPGGPCAYAVKDGVLLCGLSGNPPAALTNLYGIAYPAIRKLRGLTEYMPRMIPLKLAEDFPHKSRASRLIRGTLDLGDGTARIRKPGRGDSGTLIRLSGTDVIAEVPENTAALPAGTELHGYII